MTDETRQERESEVLSNENKWVKVMQKNNIKKHSALKLALIVITTVSTIIAGSMLAWIFTREGSYGLYRWEQSSRIYFNLSIILLVIPVCLFIVFLIINFSGKQKSSIAVLIIFFAIISIAYTTTAFSYIVANSNPVLTETKPVLLLTGITGSNGIPDIALIFRTEKPDANILYYGKEELSYKIVESNPCNQHVLIMKDLEPDSKYNWHLNNEDVYSFNTPMGYSDNPEDIIYHFAVGGDAHIGSSLNTFSSSNPYAAAGNFAATESIISYTAKANQTFDTFFILGDLTHAGIYNDNWRKAIDLLSTYSFSMPFRPVIGNHDAIFNGTNHFISYFWPNEIRSSRYDMNLYYRIDVGTTHFLMLNVLWSGKESISNSQIKWLVEQLKSIPQKEVNWKVLR